MTVLLPAWLQAGAYNAETDRSVPTGLIVGSSSTAARGGIRRWSDEDFKVTATGPATMQVIVKSGIAWVAGVFTATQGIYAVVNNSDVTLAIGAAPSSQSRFDLVIVEVLDQVYAGTDNLGRVRVVQGVPGASPTVPAVTGNAVILARILVSANVTSISTSAIVDLRKFTTANGGILPVLNEADRLATTGLPSGTEVLEVSTLRVWQWTGAVWAYLHGGSPPVIAVTPAAEWDNWSTLHGGNWELLRATKVDNIVHVQGLLTNTSSFSSSRTMFTLPAGYRPERIHLTSTWTGIGAAYRTEVMPSGVVTTSPGTNGSTAISGDYWAVGLHFNVTNHTVG